MMQQQRQNSGGGYSAPSSSYSSSGDGGGKTNFNQQKQNNFYKPIVDENGSQIKVGSDVITIDDIEQALRRNNLHQITNKDAQVYAQLHNMLMHSINVNGEVNVMDNRSPRMYNAKGKIFDDSYSQQQVTSIEGTKGWKPKSTQQVQQQQEEIKQVKDTERNVFDEPQIKDTDQQQKIGVDDDEDFTQQQEPVQQQLLTPTIGTTISSQWTPVKRPTTTKPSSPTKSPTKSPVKGGVKSPPATKSPTKGTRSSSNKLAKLQLASDSNSTDISDNSTNSLDSNTTTNSTINLSEDSKPDNEDTRLANSTSVSTQNGQNGMKIIKKIKRRRKKSKPDKQGGDVSLLTAVRSRSNKSGKAAKLVANSFEDQVKTDVSSEVEATTQSTGQLLDTTTTNANTEVQFDDTTATSDEVNNDLNLKTKVTSTTVSRQEQLKVRMLAKKRKVLESSVSTTTESSDSLIEISPDTSRDLEASLDVDSETNNNNNLQDTYFNENITDANSDDAAAVDSSRNDRSRLKSAVRRKQNQQKSTDNRIRPAHTSINSAFGDFSATFSTDESDDANDSSFGSSGNRKKKSKSKQIEPDESMENMHFRIDDVDADDYDAMHAHNDVSNNRLKDNNDDGFSSGFSNENTETSETRNQLNKLPASTHVNQTLFNSLLKNNNSRQTKNNTTLVQPIPHLVVMSMNTGNGHNGALEGIGLEEGELLENMDVNQTIAELVQKIHQASHGGDLDVISEYRNYFTEEEFDLLTDLLKREASKNTTTGSFTFGSKNQTTLSKKDQVSTSESQRKEHLLSHQILYSHFNEKDAIRKFNDSPVVYVNDNGQASLKEYYYNKANSRPEGLDVLLNIQERSYIERRQMASNRTAQKPPVPGQPLIDYPVIGQVPKKSSFSCSNRPAGYYADYESGCIRYFQCSTNVVNSQQQTFWCANGTLFDQINKVCSWWYNVDCKPLTPQHETTNLHPVYVPKE